MKKPYDVKSQQYEEVTQIFFDKTFTAEEILKNSRTVLYVQEVPADDPRDFILEVYISVDVIGNITDEQAEILVDSIRRTLAASRAQYEKERKNPQ